MKKTAVRYIVTSYVIPIIMLYFCYLNYQNQLTVSAVSVWNQPAVMSLYSFSFLSYVLLGILFILWIYVNQHIHQLYHRLLPLVILIFSVCFVPYMLQERLQQVYWLANGYHIMLMTGFSCIAFCYFLLSALWHKPLLSQRLINIGSIILPVICLVLGIPAVLVLQTSGTASLTLNPLLQWMSDHHGWTVCFTGMLACVWSLCIISHSNHRTSTLITGIVLVFCLILWGLAISHVSICINLILMNGAFILCYIGLSLALLLRLKLNK